MKVIAYKSVFNRENPKEFIFLDFIQNPEIIFSSFEIENPKEKQRQIIAIKDKAQRNDVKRNFLPAVDLSLSGILSIDIDGISENEFQKKDIVNKLSKMPICYCISESVSGNLVAYFIYDCPRADFKFLYYKLYLELTLILSVNIDFLPEIGRLRYVSLGEVYHFNKDSETVREILKVDKLPYINTSIGKPNSRKVMYASK